MKILELERLYPDPKSTITNIYTIISHEFKDNTVLTSRVANVTVKKSKFWENTLTVKWPEAMSFTSISRTKGVAAKNSALKCLLWLEMNHKLKNGKPIIYNVKDIKNMQLKPVDINVTSELLDKMTDLIETYETVTFCIIIFNIQVNNYNLCNI